MTLCPLLSVLPGPRVLRNDVTAASSARTARLKAGGEFFWQHGVGGHSAQHFYFTNPRVHSSFTLRDRRKNLLDATGLACGHLLFPDNFPCYPPVFTRVAPPVTSAVTIATTTAAATTVPAAHYHTASY